MAADNALSAATRPVISVDTSERVQHTIGFADEATPGDTTKPAGVRSPQTWVKIGDRAAIDPNELRFLATDAGTPEWARCSGTTPTGWALHAALEIDARRARAVERDGRRGHWSVRRNRRGATVLTREELAFGQARSATTLRGENRLRCLHR